MSKHCLSDVVAFITHILNLSHSEDVIPDSLKQAVIWPLIKNASLDKIIIKNYRHVSNLSQLSKVIEKFVGHHLSSHHDSQSLQDAFQSVYREGHSTTTALSEVCSDIHTAMDRRQELVWYFWMITYCCRDYLKQKVWTPQRCGLAWMRSYLHNHVERVVIGQSTVSTTRTQDMSPPGLCTGSVIFSLYTCSRWVISLEVMASAFTIMPMTYNWVSCELNPESLLDVESPRGFYLGNSPVDDREIISNPIIKRQFMPVVPVCADI